MSEFRFKRGDLQEVPSDLAYGDHFIAVTDGGNTIEKPVGFIGANSGEPNLLTPLNIYCEITVDGDVTVDSNYTIDSVAGSINRSYTFKLDTTPSPLLAIGIDWSQTFSSVTAAEVDLAQTKARIDNLVNTNLIGGIINFSGMSLYFDSNQVSSSLTNYTVRIIGSIYDLSLQHW